MNFIVIQNYFDNKEPFELHTINAEDIHEAWEVVEEEISHNMSQEWILTPEEFEELKKKVFSHGK